MGGFAAVSYKLSERVRKILTKYSTSYTMPGYIVQRSRIVLMASEGKTNTQICEAVGASYSTVSIWRNRFKNAIETVETAEEYAENNQEDTLEEVLQNVLSDKQRPGKEPRFTPEQIMLINDLACKNPKDFGYELSHWNITSIAKEAVNQGIVESISPSSVQRFLDLAGVKPWKSQYWLNSPEKHEDPESFKKR